MESKSQLFYNKHDTVAKEATKSKKAVLDQFHHMEWVKNKSGPQLSRSNSRGNHDGQTKKKEEGNYFEGTASQKKGKARRTRPSESAALVKRVPFGFAQATTSCGPPPVNAWSQKRGSELFSKPQSSVDDEEDQMLELVLKESLKTAKQDEERYMERLKMMNKFEPTQLADRDGRTNDRTSNNDRLKMMNKFEPSQLAGRDGRTNDRTSNNDRLQHFNSGKLSSPPKAQNEGEDWDDAFDSNDEEDDEYCSSSVNIVNQTKCELQFVDNDLPEEQPSKYQRKNLLPPRKSTTLPSFSANNFPIKSNDNEKTVYSPEPPNSAEIFKKPEYEANASRRYVPEERLTTLKSNEEFAKPITSLTYNNQISNTEYNRPTAIHEIEHGSKSMVNNLNDQFSSKLTFGDTQDLFDHFDENDLNTFGSNNEKYPFQGRDYSFNQMDSSSKLSSCNKSPSNFELNRRDSNELSDSEETDFILHHFLKHEPPPGLTSNPDSMQKGSLPHEMYPLNNIQQNTSTMNSNYVEHQPFINGLNSGTAKSLSIPSNGHGSTSSLASDSPLQNVTPYGTPQNCQLSPQNPTNGQDHGEGFNNMQEAQMMSHQNPHHGPASLYSGVPPGYISPNPLQGIFAVNPQMVGISPYRLANPNLMPSLPVQDIHANPQMLQTHLPNLMAMNMTYQYQQAQLAALNAEEKKAKDSLLNQNQGTHTQNHPVLNNENELIHGKAPPQVVPVQNQIPMYHMLNHPLVLPPQSQIMPPQNSPPMTSSVHNQPLQQPMVQTPQHHMLQTQHQSQLFRPALSELQSQQQIYPKEYLQPAQGHQMTQENSRKTVLRQKYFETLEQLQQIQQEMGTSQVGSPPISVPHHRPFMYPPPTAAVPVNGFYPSMGAVPAAAHYGQVCVPKQVSPTDDEHRRNSHSPQLPFEPPVGRGHGRIQD